MSCLGKKKSRQNPLYSCGHREKKYKKRVNNVNCVVKSSLRCDLMDEYVWNSLVNILSQSHQIRQETKDKIIGKKSTYTKRTFSNRIKTLNKKMNDLEINRLELEKRYYTNDMDKKRFDVLINHIEDKEQDLIDEITENQMKISSLKQKSKWISWLDIHFNRMNEIRNETDFNKKRGILNHYIHEIMVMDYDEETKQHTLCFKFRFPLFDDGFEWLKNKDGRYKLDKWGRRKYNISEGKSHLTNPLTLQSSLHRDGVVIGGWRPYLHIDLVLITQQFNPTPYFNSLTTDRMKLHTEIMKLHNKGWGYTKIHHHLIKNGFKIGKSRTTVDTIIKKIKKREEFYSQPVMDGLDNFRLKINMI